MKNTFGKNNGEDLNDGSQKVLKFLYALDDHESIIYRMAISPNGKILASPSNDCTVKLWDINSGECLHTLEHIEAVLCVAWSPNGTILASGSDENCIKIWDPATGKHIETIIVGDSIVEMSWSPDGKMLSFCTEENGVFLYNIQLDLEIIEHIFKFDENSIYFGLSWSPCGKWLSFSSEYGSLFLLDIRTYEIEESIPKHIDHDTSANYCSAWSPDGQHMAVGSADRTIIIINTKYNSDEFILEGLSPQLRAEVIKCKHGEVFQKIRFMQNKDPDFIVKLFSSLRTIKFPSNEVVYNVVLQLLVLFKTLLVITKKRMMMV